MLGDRFLGILRRFPVDRFAPLSAPLLHLSNSSHATAARRTSASTHHRWSSLRSTPRTGFCFSSRTARSRSTGSLAGLAILHARRNINEVAARRFNAVMSGVGTRTDRASPGWRAVVVIAQNACLGRAPARMPGCRPPGRGAGRSGDARERWGCGSGRRLGSVRADRNSGLAGVVTARVVVAAASEVVSGRGSRSRGSWGMVW
jgi:hypothetical protein